MPKLKNTTFWVKFKHCVGVEINFSLVNEFTLNMHSSEALSLRTADPQFFREVKSQSSLEKVDLGGRQKMNELVASLEKNLTDDCLESLRRSQR